MKKRIAALLTGAFAILASSSVLALNFPENLGNETTFESFEEAMENAGTFMKEVYADTDRVFTSNPVLEDYPEGTTWIYRSADLFGGATAAPKLNSTVVVFSGETFQDKDTARAYLEELGVIDKIDRLKGSVVLISPIDGSAYSEADLAAFEALQTAYMAQQAAIRDEDGNAFYYPEGEYFGCYGEQYVIGLNEGARFAHECIATSEKLSGTIAGMLLIGGDLKAGGTIPGALPVYLVGADETVIEEYKEANQVNASDANALRTRFYKDTKPAQCVLCAAGGQESASYVSEAFDSLFGRVMRLSATGGELPWSLCNRCAIIDGKTPQDVYVTFHQEDRFADVQTVTGEYLDTWYECLPSEVVDGSAAPGSIPLILALHGMGDDPLMFIYNQGFVELSGDERVAVVSPAHQDVFWCATDEGFVDGVEATVMPMLVEYMLKEYPALDPSRVYVSGYSMGGWATMKTLYGKPQLFAAVVPMSGMGHTPTEEQAAQVDEYNLPIMLTTSTKDLGVVFDAEAGTLGSSHQTQLNVFLGYNDMEPVEYDFDTWPLCGFEADRTVVRKLNEEYVNHTWYLNNDDGIPMVALSITEGLVHSLYPDFAKIMWNFASHYQRNVETGEVIYNEFVK